MKKTSIFQLYYFTMMCHIFALVCGIVSSIVMIVYSNEIVNNASKILGIVFITIIVTVFMIITVFSLKMIITLLKDFKSLKANRFISIVGKVVRFKKNREPESGIQINNKPIVMILETNEEIELTVNDKITVNEIYRFNYLQNCKIAEVVEKL